VAENGPEVLPKPSPVFDQEPTPIQGERKRRSASQETVQPGKRRHFTATEKLRLVRAADAALASSERGALGAVLRKEGIYSSHLSTWRRQFAENGAAGLTSRQPGRKPKLDAKAQSLLAVIKENEALKHKLRVANALIGLQKKAHELLGLTLPEPSDEET